MIVYTLPTCHECHALKRKLEEDGIEFEERDADEYIDVLSKTGLMSLPIIEEDGKFRN